MSGTARNRRLLVGVLGAAALLVLASPVPAATIHVQNTHNAGPGSLRAAVNHADPGDVITVPAGTYNLTSGQIGIDKELTIRGAGAGRTTIDANFDSRVFEVATFSQPVVISNLTITGGREQYGGGILNRGNLTIKKVVMRDNRAAGDPDFTAGGAIESVGTLKVLRSTLRDNRTSSNAEGFGGAIGIGQVPSAGVGDHKIVRSVFSRNSAPVDGFGGAIAWQTSTTPDGAALSITKSTFAGNSAIGGAHFSGTGGAIMFNPYVGTAVQVALVVDASTFTNNRATTASTDAFGGALYIAPRAQVSGSTTPVSLVNSTITGNRAGAQSGYGLGGGILFDLFGSSGGVATASLTNTTIADNLATGDNGEGGGLYTAISGTAPRLINTIVGPNEAATGRDCSGPVTTDGHNIERGLSCDFDNLGDLQQTNPMLKPLGDYGGPTKTMALKPGSPAKDVGDILVCPLVDQRGVVRPQGPGCDIGAFEARVPAE